MAKSQHGRILLVDDNLASVEFIAIELRRAGYIVAEADNGAAALEAVRKEPPDLILLDVMMPEMDGCELCRRLKGDPATEHIPIIMVTALNDRANKLQALEAGAEEFLTKPTDRAELMARVNSLLRSKQTRDELAASVEEQRRLVGELNLTIERLRTLGDLSRAVASNLDRDEVLATIVSHAVQRSGFNDGIIREYDATSGKLSYRASYGVTPDEVETLNRPQEGDSPSGYGLLDYVIRTRQPVQIADVDALTPDEQALRNEVGLTPRLERWRRLGIRAVLALPLATEDVVVGVLIMHRRTPGLIPTGTLKLLEAFAAQSVVAIQNARMLKRLQEERAAIEREQQTLAAVMDGMTDGLLVVDDPKRIRYCNAKAMELLAIAPSAGASIDSLLEQLVDKVFDPNDAVALLANVLEHAPERPSLELVLKGPPVRSVLALIFPISIAGGELHAGVLLHDVTRERELARTKDELLSVVSHELRTPLASLVGFAELLLNREYEEQQRHEFLTVMYEEGRRLTALINDFLDLQRLESGRQSVHLQPVALAPLLRHAVSAAGEDPLRPIVLRLSGDLPDVDADPDRLQQVVGNLFSNARKYSPAGGQITVTAELADGNVKVSVRDQGLGLPAEAIPKLFQKFFRVDNSDRREITGTGLGLAICRQIIAEHGGSVGAESEGLGKGSRFWFTLSIAKPTLQTGDVLIVEDDVGFGRLVEAELSNRGFTSIRAANSEAALKVVACTKPRAIVLDLLLPDMPGEQLLAQLAPQVGKTPVVVATVKELSDQERRQLEALGAVAVITKGPRVASLVGAELSRVLAAVPAPVPA
jgi:signal transduction histidine kinase/DNA-binding response OmpR family regulator